jgi:hypothetical protein
MLFIASGVRVRCQEKYSQAIGGNTARFCLTYSFLRNFFEHEVVTPQLCVLHDPLSSLPTCRFLRDTSLYGGINR